MRSAITAIAFGSLAGSAAHVRMEERAATPSQWIPVATASNAKDMSPDRIQLTFALKLRNIGELHDNLLRVSTPSSADYGRLWSLDQVNELTEPSMEARTTVDAFIRSFDKDATVDYSGGFVRAVVNISTAEKMLSTHYETFRNTKTGDLVSRCDHYSLPENLAHHVDFVAPTVNFPFSRTVASVGKLGDWNQNTPHSLRTLYGVDAAFGGAAPARQAATAFLHQYYSETDLQSFYSDYFNELSGVPLSDVIGPNGDKAGVEASLDVEYMSVMGAGVPTEFWSFEGRQPDAPANEPFLDWLYLLGNTTNPPLVFSTSYGEDETSVTLDYAERMNAEFQKNSLRGVSFLFASGDSGVGSMSGTCVEFMPMYPADSPYVTSVGATTEIEPEIGAGLSSGGFSNRWSRPSWQDSAVNGYLSTATNLPDSKLYNASGRGFPDVSAQGTGYVVVNDGATYPSVSGTSCSCPVFGGIIAMINDARIAAGKAPMGFLNPFIYENSAIFNDITSGNNPGCGTPGFYAAEGWDPITGNGTPNYQKMVDRALSLP